MSLILDLMKEYLSYIMLAVYASLAGFAYFFVIYFAKKTIKQFKNVRYLYASGILVAVNVFFIIVAIQQYNQGMLIFFESLAHFALSLIPTIIYMTLAIAVTANKNRPLKVKRIENKTIVNQSKESPK